MDCGNVIRFPRFQEKPAMFIGRQEQLAALSQLWGKRTASLVTCRGRRRIGKSTLIEEFARRTADCFINIG